MVVSYDALIAVRKHVAADSKKGGKPDVVGTNENNKSSKDEAKVQARLRGKHIMLRLQPENSQLLRYHRTCRWLIFVHPLIYSCAWIR